MRWWGLTGSIATGKTTVAARLKSRGFPVVDADVIAKEVVALGTPGLKKIVDTFGRYVLSPTGELDRARMATDVFSDPEKRRRLESIIHPMVQERVKAIRKAYEEKGIALAFYDIPLLYEKNMRDQFEAVVVVACSAHKQLERLMARNGLSKSAAAARVGSQMPIMDKVTLADHVIWNDGTLADLEAEIERFILKLSPAP